MSIAIKIYNWPPKLIKNNKHTVNIANIGYFIDLVLYEVSLVQEYVGA